MEQHKLVIIGANGEINRRGKRKEEKLLHATCLLDYIKEKYPNHKTLTKLNIKHTANTIGFFLTLYENIVLLNTTRNEEKYGKSAYLMMPAVITKEQQKSLELLLESMPTYSLTIAYDLEVVEGILDGKELSPTGKVPPIEILKMYYKKVETIEKKGDRII